MYYRKVNYLITLVFSLLLSIPILTLAQESVPEFLADQNLHKAKEDEMQGQQIMLDGVSIPVYTMEGKKIEGMAIMEMMMKGEMMPDIYMNEEKEIKAFVMRPMTADEKKMMEMSMQEMGVEGEEVGKEAATFSATDLEGNSYSLEELKGKVVVMNFWFIACKPCVMEMPELNELVEKYKGKEVVFLAFAMDKAASIKKFLEKQDFHYQIIPESRGIISDYKVSAFPTHIVLDKEGKVAFQTAGLGPMTVSQLEESISGQLGGQE